jgi:hypothetical protein
MSIRSSAAQTTRTIAGGFTGITIRKERTSFFEKKKQKTFANFSPHRTETGKFGAARNS